MAFDNAFSSGWEFIENTTGIHVATEFTAAYISDIAKEINELTNAMNSHRYKGQDIKYFKGYAAEVWHAGTFNVDAAASGSRDRARVPMSNEKDSADIITTLSEKRISVKVYADGAKSGVAQAKVSTETGRASYEDMDRLVPTDHLAEAKSEAHRRALRNEMIRPEVAKVNRETEEALVDRIINDEGVSSIPKSKKDYEAMGEEVKDGNFSAEKHGVTVDSAINPKDMLQQAFKAGLTAATITAIMKMAPEIIKVIERLRETGQIDMQQVKQSGEKILLGSGEAFLGGSVASLFLLTCTKGALGEAFKKINPTVVSAATAIIVETIKNSILVSTGKMTARQMGESFVDNIIITSGGLLAGKIGGIIGQALGFKLPVISYLIGSFIGSTIAVAYQMAKRQLISICVDTGFTCFGLVEQDYTLPEEILREMGIDLMDIPQLEVEKMEIPEIEISTIEPECIEPETIEFTVLRRGIIGVRKVGYVVQ